MQIKLFNQVLSINYVDYYVHLAIFVTDFMVILCSPNDQQLLINRQRPLVVRKARGQRSHNVTAKFFSFGNFLLDIVGRIRLFRSYPQGSRHLPTSSGALSFATRHLRHFLLFEWRHFGHEHRHWTTSTHVLVHLGLSTATQLGPYSFS